MKVLAFEFFDTKEINKSLFKVEESEPLDIHFDAMGFETSDPILNLGPNFWFLLIWPGLIIIIFLLSKCRCCPRVANWFKKQHEHTFFNRITLFLEGSIMFLGVCFSINIHQAYKGVVNMNSSFYFAFIAMVAIILYLLILLCYMLCKFKELQTEDVKKRVGAAYENLAVSTNGQPVLAFWFFSLVRRLAIAYVITFGQYSLVS